MFESYARPIGLDKDGRPLPSKLQLMLTSREKPMKVAAALRAIAYARDPAFKRGAAKPKGEVPEIAVDKASTHYGGMYGGYW